MLGKNKIQLKCLCSTFTKKLPEKKFEQQSAVQGLTSLSAFELALSTWDFELKGYLEGILRKS